MTTRTPAETRKPEQWSVKRWKQLKAMERILWECQSLNSGNGIIERIQFLVAESKKLTDGNPVRENYKDTDRAFIHFLDEQAVEGYKSKRRSVR